MIIGGTRMCGRVDENRSGYVVTRFVHIWFVPLVPLSSWFVAQGSTIQIPLSLRSVCAAYVRAFGALLALGCGLGLGYMLAFGFFSDLEIYLNGGTSVTQDDIVESVVLLVGLALGAIAGIVIYVLARLLGKASPGRCEELARRIGMPVAPL